MSEGRLAGQTAIVTGGAGGAGRAVSLLFAREGARVMVIDVQEAAGHATVVEIEQTGGTARFLVRDVSNPDACEAAVAQTVEALGPPTLLVNHAGTVIVKPFLETTVADWRRLFDINVTSMFAMCRAVLPHMLESGSGSIVNTASISGLTASPLESVYCMTKGAVIQLTRAIAVEFRNRGIRCNAVCPGFIRTDHGVREMRELVAQGEPVTEQDIAALQGRVCDPEEIARAILFLGSNDASFVNGEMLVVDNAALAKT